MRVEPFDLVKAFRLEQFGDVDEQYRTVKAVEERYTGSDSERRGIRELYREHLQALKSYFPSSPVVGKAGIVDIGEMDSVKGMTNRRIKLLGKLLADLDRE